MKTEVPMHMSTPVKERLFARLLRSRRCTGMGRTWFASSCLGSWLISAALTVAVAATFIGHQGFPFWIITTDLSWMKKGKN